jgi:predicted transcriptional regulator
MDETASSPKVNLIELTSEIVSAYVSNNSIQTSNIADLIRTVQTSLANLGHEQAGARSSRPVPPVSIKKSVSDDYLVSLEDGRRYKSLKRHLSGRGLTPEQYREKWNLPYDYPMVAANYAKQRSDLAKSMGLGRRTAEAARIAKSAKARRTATS